MPMVSAVLATSIKTQITAIPGVNITSDAELQAFCTAIATAVVTFLQANATVLPTALLSASPGSPVTGVGTLS